MRIMAVTKHIPVERILPLLRERQINLIGESRWQEAKLKLPLLPLAIEKHFIGHLQTNKAKEVVAAFDCIETLDSVNLAKAVNLAAASLGKIMPVLVQVNISNDSAKHGFTQPALGPAMAAICQLPNLRVDGLMAITAQQNTAQTVADFRQMKQLQQQFGLPELSMGMSADWELAAAAGATIVRLGSALFGQRPVTA